MISHAAHFSSWKWTNFDKEFRSNLFSWGNTHLFFWSYCLLKYIQSFFSVGTSFSLFLVFLPYWFFYFPRPFYFLSYCNSLNGNPEVATQSCSQEKLFWNYAANLQENTLAKLLCNFIEIALPYGSSPVNLMHIFRIPFLRTYLDMFCWFLVLFNFLFDFVLVSRSIEGSLYGSVH